MSTPVDIKQEKMRILLNKLSLHKLTKDEARDFLDLLYDELETARGNSRYEDYREITKGLIQILRMYLAGEIDLYESDIDVSKLSNMT